MPPKLGSSGLQAGEQCHMRPSQSFHKVPDPFRRGIAKFKIKVSAASVAADYRDPQASLLL